MFNLSNDTKFDNSTPFGGEKIDILSIVDP